MNALAFGVGVLFSTVTYKYFLEEPELEHETTQNQDGSLLITTMGSTKISTVKPIGMYKKCVLFLHGDWRIIYLYRSVDKVNELLLK